MRFPLLILASAFALAACGGGADTAPTQQQPLPTISITDATVTEGDSGTTTLVFTVGLSRSSTTNVSVTYTTQIPVLWLAVTTRQPPAQ